MRSDQSDVTQIQVYARLGRKMRQTQREYFRSRDRQNLIDSKRLEKEFDEMTDRILSQPSLLDEEVATDAANQG